MNNGVIKQENDRKREGRKREKEAITVLCFKSIPAGKE